MPVIPRWEWRSFGEGFGQIERRILDRPHDVRTSRETYILSDASDANVKIRGGQLDVKLLQRVDDGLELWTPVLKAAFPVGAEVVSAVGQFWRVPVDRLVRDRYTLEEWHAEIVAPRASLHAIDIEKVRHGTRVDGCTVELAVLTIGPLTLRTVAVEMEDPESVRRVVASLGLSGHDNVNYVQALKQVIAGRWAPPAVSRPGGRTS